MYIYSTETHTMAFARSVTLRMVHINYLSLITLHFYLLGEGKFNIDGCSSSDLCQLAARLSCETTFNVLSFPVGLEDCFKA